LSLDEDRSSQEAYDERRESALRETGERLTAASVRR
jgi:hypothetical protein